MKIKKHILITLFALILISLPSVAYAPWIWTPDGGWTSEKDLVMESPKAQWEHAQSLEEKNELNNAVRAYQALIKAYPTSPLAPKAQIKVAACYEKEGFLYKAFKAYQKLIENYPKEINFEEILEKEYQIGELFIKGKKRKLWHFSIVPAEDKGIEILQTVIDNASFSKIAPKAQFDIGVANKRNGKYDEAVAAFEKVVKNYPESQWYEESLYQIGVCNYKKSRGAAYDKLAAKEAAKSFETFKQDFPDSSHADKVNQALDQLSGRQAKGLLEVARYYEKHKHYKAAIMYYQDLVDKFPTSEQGIYAAERLSSIATRFPNEPAKHEVANPKEPEQTEGRLKPAPDAAPEPEKTESEKNK